MNNLSRIEQANLTFNSSKREQLKELLYKTYGATGVNFRELSYGIAIDINGTDSFRFIRNAITKFLDVKEDTISVLLESEKKKFASYVYLPEKDRKLQKRLRNK